MHLRDAAKPVKDLTRKQAAIMGLLADGKKIIEVADEQGMAVSTVNTHLHRIKYKLGAKSLIQAVVLFDRRLRAIY